MTAAAALERLRGSPRPRVLFVSHAFGGGVGRHIDELAVAIADDAEVLLLNPHLNSFLALRWLRPGEDLALWMRAADEWERMVELLQAIGIDRIHFHHVHGLPHGILELPRRLGCPHDVTLHDFFPACPAYHLTGADGRYCGGDPGCRHCADARAPQWGLSIDEWRSTFGELLGKAERVIAPSRDAARRIGAFFPAVTPLVWPHPELDATPAAAPLRVLVTGAISPAKGLGLLEACVRDAAARALPLHFRVLGYLARPIPVWPQLPFSIAGEYRERDLDAMIALERGDAFFFPAQCPETFSYTLSAALATPLPIVATDLGALPERLADRANARVVPWNAGASVVNDTILACVPRSAAAASRRPAAPSFAAYAKMYAAPLAGARGAAGTPLAPLEPAWSSEPWEDIGQWTLAALFDDAIGCGRASSREKLREHALRADARLAAMPAAPPEGQPHPASGPSPAVRPGEAREASRVTAPLRTMARWLRRGS